MHFHYSLLFSRIVIVFDTACLIIITIVLSYHRHLLPSLSRTWIVPSTSPLIIIVYHHHHRRYSSSNLHRNLHHHHRRESSSSRIIIVVNTVLLYCPTIIIVVNIDTIVTNHRMLPSSRILSYYHRCANHRRKSLCCKPSSRIMSYYLSNHDLCRHDYYHVETSTITTNSTCWNSMHQYVQYICQCG